jgi:hypothetical protein
MPPGRGARGREHALEKWSGVGRCPASSRWFFVRRYADRAKQIVNTAVVNEDPNDKLIRELREEVERLRALASGAAPPAVDIENLTAQARKEAEERAAREIQEAKQQLEESQRLIAQMSKSWEEKLHDASVLEEQKKLAMIEMGIAVTDEELSLPQLVNMNEDPIKAGAIIYALRPGRTTVGKPDAPAPQAIKLVGLNMSLPSPFPPPRHPVPYDTHVLHPHGVLNRLQSFDHPPRCPHLPPSALLAVLTCRARGGGGAGQRSMRFSSTRAARFASRKSAPPRRVPRNRRLAAAACWVPRRSVQRESV